MTDKQALAAVQKRWGKYGSIRFNPKAATQAERDALPKLTREQIKALSKEERDKRFGIVNGYRCTVGKVVGIGIFPMFEVRGQADTWEEAIAKGDENDRRDRERYASCK